MINMSLDLRVKREELASDPSFDGTGVAPAFRQGFNACYTAMKERETVLKDVLTLLKDASSDSMAREHARAVLEELGG